MSHESRFGLKKLCVSVSLGLAAVASAFGAWYDAPVVKASVNIGYAGNYAYYINLSEDGRYLMVNTQSGDDSFPVQLYSTADLNGSVGAMPKLALGEAFGANLYGTGGNGWKGGAISSKLGVMIPGSGAPTSGNAVYTALDMPATRWTAGVSAFEVAGLGTASVDGMDFNPAGTVLYCNSKSPQNKIVAYPVTSKSAFGTPTEFTVAAATRIRNLSVYSIGGKDLVYFGEGNVSTGAKAVYVLDPSTGTATALVTDASRFTSNIMNVKVSGAETSAPKLYVQTESSGLFVYTLAADGKSVVSTTPVRAIGHAGLVGLCGSSVTCNIASFEVSPDGRFAYLIGLSTTGFTSPALCVIANDDTTGATTIAAKTLDGTETFEVTANTIVNALTVSAASTVTVSEGKTLKVDKIIGSSVLTKSGDGEFALGEGCSTGNVVVAQGGFSVSGLGLPLALPSVASAAALHLDASDAASIVYADTYYNGMRRISEWKDTRGGSYPYAQKCASGFNGAQLPYANNSLFEGGTVVDFTTTAQWSGPAMELSASVSVREVFYVVCESSKVMQYLGAPTQSDGGPWQRSAYANEALRNGLVECDDTQVAYAARIPAGFHVVHYRLTGNLSANALAHNANTYGGIQLAEVIAFSSALTDADATAVKAYLKAKWQLTSKLNALTVAPGASVAVRGGKTLAVNTLATVDPLEALAGSAPAELANAKIHLDASEPTTFTYSGDVTAAGYKRVNKWADVRGASYPYAARTASLTMPYVNTAVLPGGVEILDFDAAGWGTATLSFSESIAVAEAFIVVKDAANDQSIINDTNGNGSWQHNQWASGYLTGGLTEVDGVATTYAADYPTGLHVFHYKPTSALSVASMVRRDTWYGGMQIAEMILFTAAQSTDAATRINNYLKTKWTNTGVWGPARTLSATADVAVGSALNATAVTGAAKFGKTGSGTMAVRNPAKASTYAVAGGCLSFEGSGAPVARPAVMNSAVLDLDASAASSITFAGAVTTEGYKRVSTWADVRGGTYPTAGQSDLSGAEYPYLNETLFPGRAVMDFTTTATWTGPAMKFSTTLSVREAFFVVCDNTKCMPYINDDASGNNGNWQRNQWASGSISGGLVEYDEGVVTTYATRLPEGFHLVHYRLTGNLSVTHLGSQANTFGGMQFGEIVLFNSALTDADASAVKNYLRRKWQRCDVASLSFGKGAEIAVADNKLVKVAAVEQPTNGKVTLGENAKLVLPAGTTVGDVSAAGGVFGSDVTLANDFVLEVPDLAKPLTIAGALTLPAIGTIRIVQDVVAVGSQTDYVLANASSVSAAANPQWKVEASPARFIYRAYVENGKLMLRVKKTGLSILIR